MKHEIEIIDMTMDDAEITVQNDMFARIIDVCSGNPARRVLQVLIDALTCTAVNVGAPVDEILDGIKLAYEGALPKDDRDN